MNMPAQRLSRRLQLTLLAFFGLSALMLVVVYVAAPSIYTDTLSLMPSPTLRSPAAAALLLVAVGVLIALLMIGVLRRWRWVFWLVLMAFSTMILDVPATILQLAGILPVLFPLWYNLCRMGISLIAVGIGIWMFHIYRHHGVWALGRSAPPNTGAPDSAAHGVKGGRQTKHESG
jgi:hypothetical protein